MMPVRALLWEIFARHRWIVGVSGVYLVLLALVVPLLPSGMRNVNFTPLLLAPLTLGLTCLIVAIGYGEETRVDGKVGGFPVRLLLLPVSTGLLITVPLLLGLIVLAIVWSMIAVWILRPCGVDAPIFWPGLFGGVVFAWLMAISWAPMPLIWVRMVVFAVVGFALILTGPVLHECVHSEPILVLLQLGLWLTALALAYFGVSKSRSGTFIADGNPWFSRSAASAATAVPATAPFRTSLRALVWLEWRLHGLPVVYLSVFYLCFLLPAVILSVREFTNKPYLFEVVANRTFQELGPAWTASVWFLFTPLLYALCGGGGAGIYAQTPDKAGLPMFVGFQPVSNEELLRAKWLASAQYLLVMWVMLLAFTAAWAVLGGHAPEMAENLSTLCGSPAQALLASLVAVVAVYVVTYLIYIGWLWTGLFGSALGTVVPASLNTLALSLGVYLTTRWQPEWLWWCQIVLWVLLGCKVISLIYLVYFNLQRRLLPLSTTVSLLVGWLAVVAPIALALTWVCDQGYTPGLALVVLLPLPQILLAPAALHRGRHGTWA